MKRTLKIIIMSLLVLCIVLSLFGCAGGDGLAKNEKLLSGYSKSESVPEYDFLSGDAVQPDSYDKYTAGVTEFSLKLFSKVATADENTVVSPYSAVSALSALANAASDTTRTQIRKTVAAGEDITVINESSHYLASRLSAFNSEEGYLKTANSLWLNDRFDVKSRFLQTLKDYYDTEVVRLSFEDSNTVNKINDWIEHKTDGEIKKMVNDVYPGELVYIINAVIMDDLWTKEYQGSDISEGTFKGTKGTADAEFMTSTEAYLSTSYAEGFIKNFKNTPLKFAAFIPKEDMSMEAFAAGFTESRYETLIESQSPMETCTATMPRFDIRTKLSLSDALISLGIRDAFDMEKADFSELSNTGSAYVSDVTQEAFIEVGPAGARAGAATVVSMDSLGATEAPEHTVMLDRPFMFVIYDNESGVPVFIGAVNNI